MKRNLLEKIPNKDMKFKRIFQPKPKKSTINLPNIHQSYPKNLRI